MLEIFDQVKHAVDTVENEEVHQSGRSRPKIDDVATIKNESEQQTISDETGNDSENTKKKASKLINRSMVYKILGLLGVSSLAIGTAYYMNPQQLEFVTKQAQDNFVKYSEKGYDTTLNVLTSIGDSLKTVGHTSANLFDKMALDIIESHRSSFLQSHFNDGYYNGYVSDAKKGLKRSDDVRGYFLNRLQVRNPSESFIKNKDTTIIYYPDGSHVKIGEYLVKLPTFSQEDVRMKREMHELNKQEQRKQQRIIFKADPKLAYMYH